MPAHRSRHAARAVTTAAAGCALTLALAAPGLARPADAGLYKHTRPAVHATLGTADAPSDPRAQAPTGSLAGTTNATPVNAPGTDVAAPDQQNPLPAPGSQPVTAPVAERPRIASIDRGVETLAVIAIAAAALLAGAGAGFAGGRRVALRTG
jgi:hypothetical protein